MPVESPCIAVCILNEQRICIGCGRTDREIARWLMMNDADALATVEKAKKRLEQLAALKNQPDVTAP